MGGVGEDLGRGNHNLAGSNLLLDGSGGLALDGAANGVGGSEDLADDTDELLGVRAGTHLAGDLVDLSEGDVAAVLDVLLLLAITWGLLERAHNQGRGGGHHIDVSIGFLFYFILTFT